MVIKVYVSGISASNEVKKRQQRALLILDSAKVVYEVVDITEPGREDERLQVQEACKSDQLGQDIVRPPPQFFNDQVHCGDYEDFNLAVDADQLLKFLHIEDSAPAEDIKWAPDQVVTNHSEPKLENGIQEDSVSQDTDQGILPDANPDVDPTEETKVIEVEEKGDTSEDVAQELEEDHDKEEADDDEEEEEAN